MTVTILTFDSLREHGPLFANLLRARTRSLNRQGGADGAELDRYDTPATRWVAVHEDNIVLAGARLTPTSHRNGRYSYTIRDAQRGLIEAIPRSVLFDDAPVDAKIWEASRIFVSDAVPACDGLRVQMQLFHELARSTRALGAGSLLGMVPEHSPRLARGVGLDCVPIGPVVEVEAQRSVCIRINLRVRLH